MSKKETITKLQFDKISILFECDRRGLSEPSPACVSIAVASRSLSPS